MAEIYDAEAERAVLGCVLQDNGTLGIVRSKLVPADMHVPAHAKILDAMLDLVRRGQPVDHLTVAETLKSRLQLDAVGGPAYLMGLDQAVPIVTNVLSYCEAVKGQSVRRRLQAFGRRLAEVAADPQQDPAVLVAKSSQHLAQLVGGGKFKTLRELVNGPVLTQLHETQNTGRSPIRSTGIRALDNMIGGRQNTLLVVAARTGVGKSAFSSSLIQSAARDGVRQGIFSLEDEGEWLGWRYLSAQSNVAGFVLEFRKLNDPEWERVGNAWGDFAAYDDNILVDDRPGLNSMEIAQAADDMVLNHGVREIWIDHLGEVDHSVHRKGTNERDIEASLRDLRGISKRHKIPVWLMCQALEGDRSAKMSDVLTPADVQGAREIVKKSRVTLGLSRDGDTMRIDALKITKGFPRRWCEVRFLNAAMIRQIEGQQEEDPYQEQEPVPEQQPLRLVPGGAGRGFSFNPDDSTPEDP